MEAQGRRSHSTGRASRRADPAGGVCGARHRRLPGRRPHAPDDHHHAAALDARTDRDSVGRRAGGNARRHGTATPVATTPAVSSTTVTQSASDNRWNVSFQMPVVSGVAPAAVTAMNDAITTRVNAYIVSFNGSGLPVVASGDAPSTLAGAFSVAFASPSLLSLRFTVETYITGAAHPTTEAGSLNFDVASGAVIQFPDLFASPAVALPVIQAQAHTLLTAKLGADLNWPASSTMADFGGAWAFTPGGLELTWSQGAIASEAEGPVTISIAWSALSSVIATPGPADGFVPVKG